MIQAHRLTGDNINGIQALYEEFCGKARTEYGWDHDPVEFDALRQAVTHRLIRGYWVEDTGRTDSVIAFMLYTIEEHRAVEVNIIYTRYESEKKTLLDRLMRLFIEDVRAEVGWDVVSYAMLGQQQELIRTMTWYGFKPVGQAIVKFDLTDQLGVQIMKQQKLDPLPEGYEIDTWKPEYAGGVAEAVFEAFSKATDARWDPRFRSLPGAKKVVGMLTGDMMGKFVPDCTSVLLHEGVPAGFCFIIQTGAIEGNIPLIGVRPGAKKKGLGNRLLKYSLDAVIDGFLAEKNTLMSITATLDTDNIAAIKMYRRMGFREEANYPHVYLERDTAQTMVVGKWC